MEGMKLKARKSFHWQREKISKISEALDSDPVDIEALRHHATSHGGLVHTPLRKKAWPKLVGVNVYDIPPFDGPPLSTHKDRAQVVLDVNRCGRRIPAHYSESKRKSLQDQLVRVILRLLVEHRGIHYYQGLHDVVITFLIVLGEEVTYAVMSVLVKYHIRDFLDADMQRTKVIISYLRPLLSLENPQLEQFITRSECEYYFSLSWLLTWYGHVVNTPEQALRLTDVFLASHPLMSVYLSAAIILSRQSKVLSLECDMAAVHGLFSKIPENLNYENMIAMAVQLFRKHPPKQLGKEGRLKLSASSLISTYPKFQQLTRFQRPDHILEHLPKKEQRGWLSWVTSWRRPQLTSTFFASVLAVTGPVLLAIALYWIQRYLRTSNPSIAS